MASLFDVCIFIELDSGVSNNIILWRALFSIWKLTKLRLTVCIIIVYWLKTRILSYNVVNKKCITAESLSVLCTNEIVSVFIFNLLRAKYGIIYVKMVKMA